MDMDFVMFPYLDKIVLKRKKSEFIDCKLNNIMYVNSIESVRSHSILVPDEFDMIDVLK